MHTSSALQYYDCGTFSDYQLGQHDVLPEVLPWHGYFSMLWNAFFSSGKLIASLLRFLICVSLSYNLFAYLHPYCS